MKQAVGEYLHVSLQIFSCESLFPLLLHFLWRKLKVKPRPPETILHSVSPLIFCQHLRHVPVLVSTSHFKSIINNAAVRWSRFCHLAGLVAPVWTCGQSPADEHFHSLRMFAVFSVVISISGSVKYSDATHLPFSDPVKGQKQKKRWWMSVLLFGSRSAMHEAAQVLLGLAHS